MIKKIFISMLLLVLAYSSYTGIIQKYGVERTFINRIDQRAHSYLNRSLKSALATYAVARSINAVISVVQKSDIALSPGGLGMNVAVGEILDPLNDLIERFSWILLAATTSLGIQKILMSIGVWLGFRVLLTIAFLIILGEFWIKKWAWQKNAEKRFLGWKIVLLAITVRFAIPLAAVCTDQIDILFLNEKYHTASQSLEQAGEQVETESPAHVESQSGGSLLSRIQRIFKSADILDRVSRQIENLNRMISALIDYIIDLIVIFIIKTIIAPIAVLWALIRLVSWIFSVDIMSQLKINEIFFRRRKTLKTQPNIT